jgi:2'-hydroxyisoflavone reductase
VDIFQLTFLDSRKLSKIKLPINSPIVDLNIDLNDASMTTYGARKFLCEKAIGRHFEGRSTFIRPGLIVGPYDTTYRFPYWGDRIAEGGNILAPGKSDSPLQFIDVRDLSEWIAKLAQTRPLGAINAVGPGELDLTLGRFLETAVSILNPESKIEWVPEDFLRERNVGCWVYLPLWVYKEGQGFMTRSSARARKLGLKYRSYAETIRDTREWSKTSSIEKLKAVTLPRERERALLTEWFSR